MHRTGLETGRAHHEEEPQMAQTIGTRSGVGATAGAQAAGTVTRALLSCGAVGGSLFMVVALAQAFSRPGFDLRRHAISMLALGDLGWIQISDFVGCGLLFVALALGVRRALRRQPAGTWGPLLLGGFGVGLVAAGIFRTDPALGFPPGAPAGMPATMSWHAMLHSLAFFVAFTSLTAACFVLARRFARLGRMGWAACCAAAGVATPLLVILGMTSLVPTGIAFAVAGVVSSWWAAAVSARLAIETARA